MTERRFALGYKEVPKKVTIADTLADMATAIVHSETHAIPGVRKVNARKVLLNARMLLDPHRLEDLELASVFHDLAVEDLIIARKVYSVLAKTGIHDKPTLRRLLQLKPTGKIHPGK